MQPALQPERAESARRALRGGRRAAAGLGSGPESTDGARVGAARAGARVPAPSRPTRRGRSLSRLLPPATVSFSPSAISPASLFCPQKHTPAAPARKVKPKEEKKPRPIQKQNKQSRQVSFSEKVPEPKPKPTSRKDRDAVTYRRLYGLEAKGKRLSMVPGSYIKDSPGKSDLELRDPAAQESSQRPGPFSRQSLADSVFQDQTFVGRRSTLLRDWIGKVPEASSYDRRLKSLIDKGAESKAEIMRILKPEEVLSCRYLRLSPNNIRTLVKLCKDVGMAVDIHPHMVEAEIDAKKVFSQTSMVAL
ncbi:uncharacterized protein C16orf78 homolog [Phyllostomus hastatus]|uniref:uncharacterized protein C16orf78 homolog n=1 Tax=Phyllostomus hastatus TaxID=9423 RepID=UPI001E68186B|nr:uncharacterized protein C16orf78 homolog [Phyllostomus hastatus]